MARAAAKRRPPARRHDAGRKHKDSGGQRYEDQLFFNRLRTHAKWVFVLLMVVFAGSFVFLGVGSGGLDLGQLFDGIRGGGGSGPSIEKPLEATEKNPKDAAAWKELASAYDTKGDYTSAISAWETYTQLRPKDAAGLTALSQDYGQRLQVLAAEAQNAQAEAQLPQAAALEPPSSSPLGRALGSLKDPIGQTASTQAGSAYQNAVNAFQQTATQLVAAYQSLARLQPRDSPLRLQLATAAETAGDTATAIAAYKQFIKLAPDDPAVPQAKAKINALEKQLAGSSSPAQG
jgi:tetratricopeptide (TPR) repeat protein